MLRRKPDKTMTLHFIELWRLECWQCRVFHQERRKQNVDCKTLIWVIQHGEIWISVLKQQMKKQNMWVWHVFNENLRFGTTTTTTTTTTTCWSGLISHGVHGVSSIQKKMRFTNSKGGLLIKRQLGSSSLTTKHWRLKQWESSSKSFELLDDHFLLKQAMVTWVLPHFFRTP